MATAGIAHHQTTPRRDGKIGKHRWAKLIDADPAAAADRLARQTARDKQYRAALGLPTTGPLPAVLGNALGHGYGASKPLPQASGGAMRPRAQVSL